MRMGNLPADGAARLRAIVVCASRYLVGDPPYTRRWKGDRMRFTLLPDN